LGAGFQPVQLLPEAHQAGTVKDYEGRRQHVQRRPNHRANAPQRREYLKGQQNAGGPSSSSVESAESGGGVAGRANVAKQREFKQQFESLVHRDDIPESLKLGVREYFERVHETEPESE